MVSSYFISLDKTIHFLKILYVHQYFKTPEEGGAIRSYYLSKALIEAGHEVIMLTAGNQKSYQKIEIEGIEVHKLPVFYENTLNYRERVLAFLKFLILSILELRKIRNVDLCFCTSTPLTVALIGLHLKFWRKTPFVFEVRDLWPEAPIQLNILRNPLLIFISRRLEALMYRKSDLIIALSDQMKTEIKRKTAVRVVTITNMSDCDFFHPSTKTENEPFTIGYFGSLGKANQIEKLTTLGRLIGNKAKILICGKGSEKTVLLKNLEMKSIENIEFLPYQNKYELRDTLKTIDAAYISFADFPVLKSNSPNKLFDALAAGKLIISNIDGWWMEYGKRYNFAIHVDKTPESIARLVELMDDRKRIIECQKNARYAAEKEFSRKKLSAQFVEYIESI
jgi:glycosyltransferase involved in cell wall biosynthesis